MKTTGKENKIYKRYGKNLEHTICANKSNKKGKFLSIYSEQELVL